MSIEELDEQIRITQAILDQGGYNKLVNDRLTMLNEERDERLIEQQIVEGSSYAQTVLGMGHKSVPN